MPHLDAPAVVFDGFFDGVVFFGETHQLEADGVDEGFPTGVDDVFADAYGAPTAAVVAPFDEDADMGGGAFVGIEDADFVVGQADFRDLRIQLGKALAQADVEASKGPCPDSVAVWMSSRALTVTVAVETVVLAAARVETS